MSEPLGHPEPPSDAIFFSGRLSDREFQQATARGARGTLGKMIFLVAVMGFLVVITTLPSQGAKALLFLLPALLLPPLLIAMTRALGRRQWKSSPLLRAGVRGWVGERGLHVEHELAIATFDWRAFAGFEITDSLVLLFQSSQTYNLFSRSLFTSDDDWQRFRALVEARIGRPRPQPMGKVPVALTVAILALIFLLLLLVIAL